MSPFNEPNISSPCCDVPSTIAIAARDEIRILALYYVSKSYPELDFIHDQEIGKKVAALGIPGGFIRTLSTDGPLAKQIETFTRTLAVPLQKRDWFFSAPELRKLYLERLKPARCSIEWDHEHDCWVVYRTKEIDGVVGVCDFHKYYWDIPLKHLIERLQYEGFEIIDSVTRAA